MAYRHGVYTSEQATSILPPVTTSAGLPVIFGTAPVHMSADGIGTVNELTLCYTYAEAVEALGFIDANEAGEFEFTLCEAMSAFFALNQVAPIVLVNVLDPATHKASVASEAGTLNEEGEVTLVERHAVLSTIVVKDTGGATTYVAGTDYTVSMTNDGYAVVSRLEGGTIAAGASLELSYDHLDPSAVTSDDIVGGIDVGTGKKTGLELVANVFPQFRLVPGQVLAPKFSMTPTVAIVMSAKVGNINGVFKATCLVDIPTDTVAKYQDAPGWKNDNSYTDTNMVVCWPMGALDGVRYHMSTLVAALCMSVDAGNSDIPYESPSNKGVPINAIVLADGTEVVMDMMGANFLNGEGVVTAQNFIGGWRAWGNRTGAYPANTDPKDSFIPIRRMFNWDANVTVLTYFQKVDDPMNRRLIETVVDSENIRLNGLAARQFILGGRLEFRDDENPVTDLIDGIARFHKYITPPAPARELDFIQEFDPAYVDTLFA